MIKPEGVIRRIVGTVISKFERRGYKLIAMKIEIASSNNLKEQFGDESRTFLDYMRSGPVVLMVWEGDDVVKNGLAMAGDIDPADAAQGTIRGNYAVHAGRNVIYASDGVGSAQADYRLWFGEEHNLTKYNKASEKMIYDLAEE